MDSVGHVLTCLVLAETHVRIQRGDRGSGPLLWKIKKIKGSLAILVLIPLKSQSYYSSIHCWAIIGPPAKRHLNGVSLAGR